MSGLGFWYNKKFPECILSVEDVAVALVDELENNNQFVKQRFTAAY